MFSVISILFCLDSEKGTNDLERILFNFKFEFNDVEHNVKLLNSFRAKGLLRYLTTYCSP